LWLAGRAGAEHGPLRGEIAADVVVVAGGIAGVTTALRLQREGVNVVLLEAVAIGSGVTGNTSAKVSALQGTTVSTIVSRHGTEAGEVDAAASASAVENVAALAEEEKVDCGLERRPAVTYAANPGELKAVADERDAALGAGLPFEWRDDDAGKPYPVSGGSGCRTRSAFSQSITSVALPARSRGPADRSVSPPASSPSTPARRGRCGPGMVWCGPGRW
jgi:monoamine oxidase